MGQNTAANQRSRDRRQDDERKQQKTIRQIAVVGIGIHRDAGKVDDDRDQSCRNDQFLLFQFVVQEIQRADRPLVADQAAYQTGQKPAGNIDDCGQFPDVEMLLGVGGGLVVIFQHLFPVALVYGVAGFVGGAGSVPFFRHRLHRIFRR